MLCAAGVSLHAPVVAQDGPRDCPAAMTDPRPVAARAEPGATAFGAAAAQSLLPGGRVSRDRSCYRSAADVERALATGTAVLVDVRDPRAFARLRIAGSLNIEPRALAQKVFLRARAVVLVDTGRASAHLERLCRSLRAAGFANVSILDGGLRAWRGQAAALEGDAGERRALTLMSAAEFFQERHYAHWVVVELDRPGDDASAAGDGSAGVQPPHPDPPRPGGSDGKDLRGKVDLVRERLMRAAAQARDEGLEPFLLAVTADGAGLDAFQGALERAAGEGGMVKEGQSPRPAGEAVNPGGQQGLPREGSALVHAYFLEGGRAGYEQFLRSQQALLSYRHRLPNRKGCGPVD